MHIYSNNDIVQVYQQLAAYWGRIRLCIVEM